MRRMLPLQSFGEYRSSLLGSPFSPTIHCVGILGHGDALGFEVMSVYVAVMIPNG